MYTIVIISLWSSLYIAHSAKILKTGKIYICVHIYEENTFQSGTCPLSVKNESAMNCRRIVRGHRIPFNHIQHPTSDLSHVPYTVFSDSTPDNFKRCNENSLNTFLQSSCYMINAKGEHNFNTWLSEREIRHNQF